MNAACNTLADRIEGKRAAGLVDVKFYVSLTDDTTLETVCDEVTALYDAVDQGKVEALAFMD